MRSVEQCPSCKVDLTGPAIPQKYLDAGHYGTSTHYQRTISLVENDHHVAWRCPDCGHEWGRKSPLKESTPHE